MTQIRPRQPTPAQQADALVAGTRPTASDVRRSRQAVAAIAWQARAAGDWGAYRAVMRRLRDLRQRGPNTEWKSPEQHAATQTKRRESVYKPRSAPPAQQARQLADLASLPERQARVREQQRQRDLARYRANGLAHALWALHQGHRDWTPLPTESAATTNPPAENAGGKPLGAAYIEVVLSETRFGPACKLRLFRSEYEELLTLWGYHAVGRASRLREKLQGKGSNADLDALYAMALSASQSPNLALSWRGYVTGSRLGDVFTEHAASSSMQLASGRSGDLREAAQQVLNQCTVIELDV